MFARLFDHPGVTVIVILLIVLLLGWKRLPDMARSLGRSSRILKSEIDEMKTESKSKASQETVAGESTTRADARRQSESATHPTEPVDGATRADERGRDI